MFHFKAGTFMSRRGEGEVEVSMGLRNVFGYADQFEIEAVRGASLSSTYSALWRQRPVGSDVNLDVRAFQALECFKKLSSFDVTSRGISVDLTGDGPGTLTTRSPGETCKIRRARRVAACADSSDTPSNRR